jgi:hypothetical protein
MMLRIQYHQTQEQHGAVQTAAKRLGISSGEYVRRAIDRALELEPAPVQRSAIGAGSSTAMPATLAALPPIGD